jgi:hypothetical protein
MASREIDVKFQNGGAEFMSSLERLGLHADALFWAFDRMLNRFVLVLVTDEYDYAGPYAMSKVLFEAYNKAILPIEIDPFIVRVHSPQQWIIQEIGKFLPFSAGEITVSGPDGKPVDHVSGVIAESMNINAADLEIDSRWVYRFEKTKKRKTTELSRRWIRFSQNVARAA